MMKARVTKHSHAGVQINSDKEKFLRSSCCYGFTAGGYVFNRKIIIFV